MKYLKPKIVYLKILIGLLPYFGAAQIPVTDVAANAQLVILNQNVATLNSQLVTLNSTMGKLLAQMERNVTANSSASKILSQDLTAKRTPASYVMGSPEMTELYDLKDKIVEAYKGTQKNLRSFANLEKVEKERKDTKEKESSALSRSSPSKAIKASKAKESGVRKAIGLTTATGGSSTARTRRHPKLGGHWARLAGTPTIQCCSILPSDESG